MSRTSFAHLFIAAPDPPSTVVFVFGRFKTSKKIAMGQFPVSFISAAISSLYNAFRNHGAHRCTLSAGSQPAISSAISLSILSPEPPGVI
jgi:hypothetical protein